VTKFLFAAGGNTSWGAHAFYWACLNRGSL
jgi:hypothetical protein